MQAMQLPKDSRLPKLFDAWGLEMVEGQIAADRTAAIRVPAGTRERPEAINHVLYLALNAKNKNIDRTDPITGQLDSVNVVLGGVLQKKAGAATEFTPLLSTGKDSMMLPASMVQFSDPKKLLADFAPGDKELTIAARITGKVKSAFTGPPAAAPDPNAPTPEAPAPPSDKPHVAEAADPINVVVVADCDFLSNQLWVNEQLAQMGLISKWADNGDFVVAAADNLSGSSDLMSVPRPAASSPAPSTRWTRSSATPSSASSPRSRRSRPSSATPSRRSTISSASAPDQAGGGAVLLTPEQTTAIENFRKEQVDTRKKLRDVRHQLRKDIEGLDRAITFINVGFMPLLVGLLAISLSAWRVRRRSVDRTATKALS